jgi:hypothetical protein
MKRSSVLLSLFCALACVVSARADLTITLSPSVQNGPRGQEVVFSGTLTNTSGTDKLFLNDIQATLSASVSPYLTLKSNAFFSNVPGILLPGESYSNSELFRVSLGALAAPGDYPGTIIINGGANLAALTNLANADFVVSSPWKIVSVTRLPNNHVVLQCFGVASVANTIQASPDFATPFATLAAPTADGTGAFQYEDANAGSFTTRFYQLAVP